MKALFFTIFFFSIFPFSSKDIMQESSESKITFKIKNMGVFVDGKFSDYTIDSNLNLKDLNNSYINASIKVTSLDTDNKKRDKDLLKSKYFDVNKYSNIIFESNKIEKSDVDSVYVLSGYLTIKNVKKMIKIPFSLSEINDNQIINASFQLNRKDYKVGGNSWVMSDEVFIDVIYKIDN